RRWPPPGWRASTSQAAPATCPRSPAPPARACWAPAIRPESVLAGRHPADHAEGGVGHFLDLVDRFLQRHLLAGVEQVLAHAVLDRIDADGEGLGRHFVAREALQLGQPADALVELGTDVVDGKVGHGYFLELRGGTRPTI